MLITSRVINYKMNKRLCIALILLCCIQALIGQQPSIISTTPLLKDPTVEDFRCSLGLTSVVCGAVFQNRTAALIIMNTTSTSMSVVQLSTDADPIIRVSTTSEGKEVCVGFITPGNVNIRKINLDTLNVDFQFSPALALNYTDMALRGGTNECHVLFASETDIIYKRWDQSSGGSLGTSTYPAVVVDSGNALTLAAYQSSNNALGCWRESVTLFAFCAVFNGGTIVPTQMSTLGVVSFQAMVLSNPERSVVIYGQQSDSKPFIFRTTGANAQNFTQSSTTPNFGLGINFQAGTVSPGLLSVTFAFADQLYLVTYDPDNVVTGSTPFVVSQNLTNVQNPRYTTMIPAFANPFSFISYFDPSKTEYTGVLIRNYYCGDGIINNQTEQCDGGFRCASCTCALGFASTTPASLDCQAQPNQGRTQNEEALLLTDDAKAVNCAINDNRNTSACARANTESLVLYEIDETNQVTSNFTLVNTSIPAAANNILIKSMPNGNWAVLVPINSSSLLLTTISGSTFTVLQQDVTVNLSSSAALDMLVFADQSIGIFFLRGSSLFYKRYSAALNILTPATQLALTSIDFDVVLYKNGFLVMNQDPQALYVDQFSIDAANKIQLFTYTSPVTGTPSLPNLVRLEAHLIVYYRVSNAPSTFVTMLVYNLTNFQYLSNFTYDSTYMGSPIDIAALPNDFAVYYDQTGLAQIVQFFNGQLQLVGNIFPWDALNGGYNNFTSVSSSLTKATFATYWLAGSDFFIQFSSINTSVVFPVEPAAGPALSPGEPSTSPTGTPQSTPTNEPQGNNPQGLVDWVIAIIVISLALVVGGGTFLAIFFIRRDKRKRKKRRESVNMSPQLPSRLSVNVTADDSHYMAINSPNSAGGSHHSTSKSSSGIDMNSPYNPNNRWEINPKEITISDKLGGGAFGVIYKGRWKYTVVAIKSTNIDSDLAFEELKKEALLMTSVRPHPNILPIFGYYREGEKFNLVMEFQGGGNIYQMLKSDPTNPLFSSTRLINLVHGIASGLEMLHSMNIVHRDIAARNILMSDSGIPKVSDFGMARAIGENKAGITTSNIGPIAWMAPESLRSQLYSDKTDVWAFGVLLWEIMTKKEPFAGTQLIDLAIKIREGLTLPIPDDCAELFQRIMKKCWEFDPADRPTMSEILAELDDYKTNHQVT